MTHHDQQLRKFNHKINLVLELEAQEAVEDVGADK
eukprot:CAMPEP_0206197010 /NCGR_PEP_ID=MMETSP0166-20121206/8780_1 /ASSEMBLY_ACC=CAM_ASM_000260 /TAXON_ID=95228 /ORGANISM="Vannella robusta, Strain DIVA3 518/3/11/1/6" /LENGTH=34 /DNA_ID= /DNA_START= /DNA_END= /DNA_ORIENTATION=